MKFYPYLAVTLLLLTQLVGANANASDCEAFDQAKLSLSAAQGDFWMAAWIFDGDKIEAMANAGNAIHDIDAAMAIGNCTEPLKAVTGATPQSGNCPYLESGMTDLKAALTALQAVQKRVYDGNYEAALEQTQKAIEEASKGAAYAHCSVAAPAGLSVSVAPSNTVLVDRAITLTAKDTSHPGAVFSFSFPDQPGVFFIASSSDSATVLGVIATSVVIEVEEFSPDGKTLIASTSEKLTFTGPVVGPILGH